MVKIELWIFAACTVGFGGPGCVKQCTFPSYGKDCRSECSCSKSACHYAYGCDKQYEGKVNILLFFLNNMKSNMIFLRNQQISFNVINIDFFHLVHIKTIPDIF